MSGRPQSAHSRSRIDAAAGVKVFGNSLFDAGDILAGQPDLPATPARTQAPMAQPTPLSPLAAGSSAHKLQQQKVLAAQKRLERLQMGGLAQNNDSIALVTISNARPGTPKAAALADLPSILVPAPPPAPPAGPGGRRGSRAGGLGSMGGAPEAGGDSRPGMRPPQQQEAVHKSAMDEDEDLEVETLEDPVRPGAAAANSASAPRQHSGGGDGAASLKQPQRAAVDLSDLAAFLLRPAPAASAGRVMCCIERIKSSLGKPPTYRFHLEVPNGGYRFLLAARKRLKTTTSSYVITTSADDLSRRGSSCIAKLRSNLLGTAFAIVAVGGGSSRSGSAGSSRPTSAQQQQQQQGQQQQHHQQLASSTSGGQQRRLSHPQRSLSRSAGGMSSSSRDSDGHAAWQQGGSSGGARQELGAVMYETNVLGTRGPRRMSAAVPAIDAAGNSLWPAGSQDSIAERARSGSCEQLVLLKNKAPKWNEALNAYCLNFNGRVTEASVKNFQLVTEHDPDTVVLQFGKVSSSTFTCDFCAPLSPLQAFAMCLSSFDNKLACE